MFNGMHCRALGKQRRIPANSLWPWMLLGQGATGAPGVPWDARAGLEKGIHMLPRGVRGGAVVIAAGPDLILAEAS